MFRVFLRFLHPALCAALVLPAIGAPALRNLPLRFEPNAGQWDAQVRFAARTAESTLLLTGRDALLAPRGGGPVVGVHMEGAGTPALEGMDALPMRSNYFVGSNRSAWRTGLGNWARVRARNVYPGIDVIYYGKQGRLEYDFMVAPGADPGQIRMRFSGPGRLTIGEQGELALAGREGCLVQLRPRIFQGGKEIAGRYKLLASDTAGIELAAYDSSRPLTIDPVLHYATLVGGTEVDSVTAVKPGPDGTFYVAGYITTTSIASRGGPYQDSHAGKKDGFLARIDMAAGMMTYFTYIGGSGDDVINDMAVDADGVAYLVGTTNSTNFPTAGEAHQSTNGGTDTTDAFVVKIDPRIPDSGALLYSSYLGGAEDDTGNGIGVDSRGSVYITGATKSERFPLTNNALQNARWGFQDAYIARFDIPNATLAYSSYLGGETWDDGRSIAVTKDDQVYIAGSTLSTNYHYTGTGYRREIQGSVDVFVTRIDFSKSGDDSLAYSTFLGGTGSEEARRITVDREGKLLITGYTLSGDFPVTGDALQASYGGNGNAFVVRLDPAAQGNQQLLYSSYLGGSGGDVGQDISTDAAGNVYVTGYTLSRDFPLTDDALQKTWGAGTDSFMTKFRLGPAPAMLFSTYLGFTGINVGYSLSANSEGALCLGGYTGNRNAPSTDSTVQNSYAGGLSDGFVLVLAP